MRASAWLARASRDAGPDCSARVEAEPASAIATQAVRSQRAAEVRSIGAPLAADYTVSSLLTGDPFYAGEGSVWPVEVARSGMMNHATIYARNPSTKHPGTMPRMTQITLTTVESISK